MVKTQGKLDALLLVVVIVLVVFGVIMVFSASFYSTMSAEEGPYQYLKYSVQWALLGFAVMIGASFVPYRVYFALAPAFVVASIIFLLMLYTPLGEEANNATRWIRVGELTFMPGEFAKLAVIFGCAWYYTKYADKAKTFVRGFCAMAPGIVVYFYLIYRQPNLSTAIIVAFTILVIMYFAGVRIWYLIGFVIAAIILVRNMVISAEGEHLNRISGFLDPFSDAQGEFFQTVQGLIALGSGGLTGVGLGNSVQKAFWLPFAQNDFIFAIIGEEMGFLGCIFVLIAFVVLIWRCLLIAMRNQDRFAMLTGGGVAMLFAIQVIINIGVVTSLLPPTGVTLPFISYGGNAIILFMFLIGVMLNISRKEGPKAPRIRKKQEEEEEAA